MKFVPAEKDAEYYAYIMRVKNLNKEIVHHKVEISRLENEKQKLMHEIVHRENWFFDIGEDYHA